MKNRCRTLHLLWLLALAACTEASGPQMSFPEKLVRVSSESLEGEPGFAVAESLAVRVIDGNGNGVSGQDVEFRVVEGNGSVHPALVQTDASGIARTQWQLGTTPGMNAVEARLRNADMGMVKFRATGKDSPGSRIERISGGGGIVIGGCPLPAPLVVRVTDNNGQPVANAAVEFTADANGGVAEPGVVRTDAQGLASAIWRPGLNGGSNTMRAILRTSTAPFVTFTADSRPIAPGGYATIGNKIYNAECKEHLFHGVARPSLQWTPGGDDQWVNVAQDFARIKSWKANVVRIPITQIFWVPGNKQYDASYKPRVVDAVRKARAAGLAVIIDLHASDRGNDAYDSIPDVQQMPDLENSLPFWRDVANTFKDDGGVIFELYNEPHEVSWDVWLNGGEIAAGPRYPGGPFGHAYRAVGMQQLYDAVRATGANNLIIISGTHWGYFLDGVRTHRVQGYNIVYGSHPYDWPDKQPDTWEAAWGFLAATDPVIITEFGAYACTRLDYYEAVLNYAERKGISWIAWAWWTPPPVSANFTEAERNESICRFPSLIRDWNGTPSNSGQLIKNRLSAY